MKTSPALLSLLLVFGSAARAEEAIDYPKPVGEEAYALLESMYDYGVDIPLEARAVELKEEEGTIRRKIVFRGARGYLVPGYLEVKADAPAPYPCVLLMHGWSGGRENWWRDGGYIHGGEARRALLERGFAVFALDAQAHGDRIAENGYALVNDYSDPGDPPRKNLFTLRDIITQTILDYRRGLDYLATRGDIDMGRIGAVGYSMGGFHAVALTAVEPRIQAAAGCVVPVTWREDPILDPANYLRGIGGRPFMMLQGKTDPLCDEAHSNALFSLIAGETARLVQYDAGHKLPSAWVDEAIPWLADRL
ncbi:MAG: alpha/beta fold hydrolase [Candidatus Hydrogenedentes bacterium]|nr:alpha/beta fold hydrolase [Candidatus Hydrogenedentota bacterium]